MEPTECTHNKKTKSPNNILTKYDEVLHAHTSDIKRVNENITTDCEKFLQYYEESSLEMEALEKSLQQREYEVKKREQKLLQEKTKLQLKKRVRERLSSCKQLVNECYSSRKVAEDLKNELNMLHKRRVELEAQLKSESFESLQTKIIQLETALQVIEDNDRIDPHEKLKNLQRELIEKDEQLQELKNWSKALSLRIDGKNDELEDARKELIDGMSNSYASWIKTMGEVELTPFRDGHYSSTKAMKDAVALGFRCGDIVKDRNWRPFTVGPDKKEIIDEKDEKLVRLKEECNEEQYRAVLRALNERIQYGLKRWDRVKVLWNRKDKRKASLRESIDSVLKEWKILKQRRMY